MYLVYRDELGGTHSFPLQDARAVTIGRETTRDVVLDDRQVSRHHASIETVSGSFLLRDAGSANGTFLNGLRLSEASAIALRDGDVIELGRLRVCFAADVAFALASLAPLAAPTSDLLEQRLPHADLLRDGLAAERTESAEPCAPQVLRAFAERPLALAMKGTLDLLVRRLELDVAAAFLLRRRSSPELVAARPSEQEGRELARSFNVTDAPGVARLFSRTDGDVPQAPRLNETCTISLERSAAAVPFFSGSTLLGVLAVERFRGERLDRKSAAVVAVFGERIARALSIRGGSPHDTPVGVVDGVDGA